ncbi:MAG: RagB/SusD family nutrient uptake outer membrane protein [Pedobacter sp.]|uniref:RagB/SusD family nutrient uptake outer membrane protein n=1 Tax=Pedobacter sp. TaxID=1411316 RepID=UPI00356673CF
MKIFGKKTVLLLIVLIITACEGFIDEELPKDMVSEEMTFNNERMAAAALTNIYTLMRNNGFLSGNRDGISYLLGCYADELEVRSQQESGYRHFFQGSVLSNNQSVKNLWNNTYSQIYAANNVVEGVIASTALSVEVKNQLLGEALAIRGLLHFYLTQTFGNIPYVKTTDYNVNRNMAKTDVGEVMKMVKEDLLKAEQLLIPLYPSGEKVRINRRVVQGFLARVNLYEKNWSAARAYAELVIDDALYDCDALDKVFLKGSKSAVWQFKTAVEGVNTLEGGAHIFIALPVPNARLHPVLLDEFDPGDQRKVQWVKQVGTDPQNTHAFKYRQRAATASTLEYSVIIRIEEMYLIVAEATAEQGDMETCSSSLDVLRSRAGLPRLDFTDRQSAVDAILKERRLELFAEFGHRFYDLKRMGRMNDLSIVKQNWQEHFRVLPLPENELLLNPNMLPQNFGY